MKFIKFLIVFIFLAFAIKTILHDEKNWTRFNGKIINIYPGNSEIAGMFTITDDVKTIHCRFDRDMYNDIKGFTYQDKITVKGKQTKHGAVEPILEHCHVL